MSKHSSGLHKEPLMRGKRLNKFRTVVSKVSFFVGNPVCYLSFKKIVYLLAANPYLKPSKPLKYRIL